MDTPVHPRQQGYHLSELLITLFIIGILASMAFGHLLFSYQDRRLNANYNSTFADIENIKSLADSTLGELPMTYGMSQVIGRFSAMTPVPNPGNFVGNCPTEGGATYRLPNGVIVTNVDTGWPDASASPPLNPTVWATIGNKVSAEADDICVALNGIDSRNLGREIRWFRVFRGGEVQLVELNVGYTGTVMATTVAVGGILDLQNFLGEVFTGGGYDLPPFLLALFGPAINSFNQMVDDGIFTMGDVFGNSFAVRPNEMAAGLSINGVPWEEIQPKYSSTFIPAYSIFDLTHEEKTNYFQIREAIEDQISTLVGKNMGAQAGGWTKVGGGSDFQATLDALENLNVTYYDKTTRTYYQLSGVSFYSPVKLSLNGVSAKLNSDDHFAFDIDGKAGKLVPIITTGGLNHNEAWLATDRNHDGFWAQSAQDGRDVFGDHMGQFPSGYEDLAKLYKHALKKDASGKRYIPLNKLSFIQKQQANLTRLSAVPKTLDPSIDLKLITRDKKVLFASDYVDKIYVDYQNVNELDTQKRNWIGQRASIHYLSGQTTTSADQWFQAGFIFKPLDKSTAQKLIQKPMSPHK